MRLQELTDFNTISHHGKIKYHQKKCNNNVNSPSTPSKGWIIWNECQQLHKPFKPEKGPKNKRIICHNWEICSFNGTVSKKSWCYHPYIILDAKFDAAILAICINESFSLRCNGTYLFSKSGWFVIKSF